MSKNPRFTPLDPSKTIHGMYGKVMIDGSWQTNLQECTATVELDKKELALLGHDWVQHKTGRKKGSGNFKGFKVTSELIQRGFSGFEMLVELNDPEAYGHETILLKNCIADKIDLVNLKADDLVEEETSFTFDGYELLDPIEA